MVLIQTNPPMALILSSDKLISFSKSLLFLFRSNAVGAHLLNRHLRLPVIFVTAQIPVAPNHFETVLSLSSHLDAIL